VCHSIDPTTQPLHGSQSALFGTLNGRSRTPAILGESEGWAGEVFGSVLSPSPSAVGYPAGRLWRCHNDEEIRPVLLPDVLPDADVIAECVTGAAEVFLPGARNRPFSRAPTGQSRDGFSVPEEHRIGAGIRGVVVSSGPKNRIGHPSSVRAGSYLSHADPTERRTILQGAEGEESASGLPLDRRYSRGIVIPREPWRNLSTASV
jgi:hypothetical protein